MHDCTYHDLSLHCNTEEDDKIEHKNRPEHRDIEDRKESQYKCYHNSACSRVPAQVVCLATHAQQ